MKNKLYVLIFTLVLSASSLSCNSKRTNLPGLLPVNSNELSCKGLIYSGTWKEKDKNYLTSELKSGSSKIALKIDGNILKFLTEASVGAGVTEAAEFTILENTKEYLLAAMKNTGLLSSPSLNSFVLNKNNGLGVWTKSRPSFLTIDAPVVDVEYLNCY